MERREKGIPLCVNEKGSDLYSLWRLWRCGRRAGTERGGSAVGVCNLPTASSSGHATFCSASISPQFEDEMGKEHIFRKLYRTISQVLKNHYDDDAMKRKKRKEQAHTHTHRHYLQWLKKQN